MIRLSKYPDLLQIPFNLEFLLQTIIISSDLAMVSERDTQEQRLKGVSFFKAVSVAESDVNRWWIIQLAVMLAGNHPRYSIYVHHFHHQSTDRRVCRDAAAGLLVSSHFSDVQIQQYEEFLFSKKCHNRTYSWNVKRGQDMRPTVRTSRCVCCLISPFSKRVSIFF